MPRSRPNFAIKTTPMTAPTTPRQMKSAARFFAVQALFQMETSGQTVEAVCAEFLDHRFGAQIDDDTYMEGNPDHFRHIIDAAINHQAQIDQRTDQALVVRWPIDRIDPTLRAVFRAAGAELLDETTPPKVVISEYLDVITAFFPDGKERALANGVLDHMAHAMRPDAF